MTSYRMKYSNSPVIVTNIFLLLPPFFVEQEISLSVTGFFQDIATLVIYIMSQRKFALTLNSAKYIFDANLTTHPF